MVDSIEALITALAQELKSASPLQGSQQPIRNSPVLREEAPNGKQEPIYTTADYPMLEKHAAEIRTPTGRSLADLTLENVLDGKITIQDVRISREMLHAQAQIAADAGKPAMGENLRRAAELIPVPDDKVIAMYNLLRPNRATAAQLEALAQELETLYNAPLNAGLVREAAEVYRARGILRRETKP